MLSVDSELKKSLLTYQNARLTILTKSGETVIIENDRILEGGLKLDRSGMSGGIEVGSAIASDLSVKIVNYDGFYDTVYFEKADIKLEIGDSTNWVNFGHYIIDTQPRRQSVITLNAMDYMVRFDLPVVWSEISFPITVANLVRKACQKCGVLLNDNLDSLINSSVAISKAPDNAMTWREVIQSCSCAMAKCATITPEGKLSLKWYTYSNEVIDASKRYSSDIYESSLVITGTSATIDGVTYSAGTDGYVVDISDIFFLDAKNADNIVKTVNTFINHFEYVPCTISSLPYIWLEPFDRYSLGDVSAIVGSISFTLNGNCSISGTADTTRMNGKSSYSSLSKKIFGRIDSLGQATKDEFNSLYTRDMTNYCTVDNLVSGVYISHNDVPMNWYFGSMQMSEPVAGDGGNTIYGMIDYGQDNIVRYARPSTIPLSKMTRNYFSMNDVLKFDIQIRPCVTQSVAVGIWFYDTEKRYASWHGKRYELSSTEFTNVEFEIKLPNITNFPWYCIGVEFSNFNNNDTDFTKTTWGYNAVKHCSVERMWGRIAVGNGFIDWNGQFKIGPMESFDTINPESTNGQDVLFNRSVSIAEGIELYGSINSGGKTAYIDFNTKDNAKGAKTMDFTARIAHTDGSNYTFEVLKNSAVGSTDPPEWGNIRCSGVDTTSDRRLKRDIKDMDVAECISLIKNLSPKQFAYNKEEEGRFHYGLIAQEVLPHIREGNMMVPPLQNEEDYYSVNYTELIPVLIKTVQYLLGKYDGEEV